MPHLWPTHVAADSQLQIILNLYFYSPVSKILRAY